MNIQQGLCGNELRKVGLLITEASRFGMDLEHGEVGVNSSSGNVWLWDEDFNFSLYLDLNEDDIIYACWNHWDTDREEIIESSKFHTIYELNKWAEELEEEEAEKEEA